MQDKVLANSAFVVRMSRLKLYCGTRAGRGSQPWQQPVQGIRRAAASRD